MKPLEVRIVRLDPMRVASVHGFGASPEAEAWQKLRAFMQATGLLAEAPAHRYFGFNNPSPTPASPNYGYEQWVTIGPEVRPQGDAAIKDFQGGLYAVTRCDLSNIEAQWKRLAVWQEDSSYKMGRHQWLEESLTPALALALTPGAEFDPTTHLLDLYLPVL